jgi:hypothetical protein
LSTTSVTVEAILRIMAGLKSGASSSRMRARPCGSPATVLRIWFSRVGQRSRRFAAATGSSMPASAGLRDICGWSQKARTAS